MASRTLEAFVTLATNDSYATGALALGHSLKKVNTTRPLVCMVTYSVSTDIRHQLASIFTLVDVNVLDSNDTTNLELLSRPDLGITFTKLHCWRLTQFTKCVFLDADTIVLKNIDDLFEREEFSAASDVGWPDCFNSGVFVFKPSQDTYRSLLHYAITNRSFDGGDQGLLNMYFSDWATKDIKHRLPFIYNVVAQAFYSYLPAFKRFGKDTKVLHFIGSVKPWHCKYNPKTGYVDVPGDSGLGQHSQFLLKQWWDIFSSIVNLDETSLKMFKLKLSDKEVGFHHESQHSLHGSYSQDELDDYKRQHKWEKGQIDYMGIDSFENIQKQLDSKIVKLIEAAPPPQSQQKQSVEIVQQETKSVTSSPVSLKIETSPCKKDSITPPIQAVARGSSPLSSSSPAGSTGITITSKGRSPAHTESTTVVTELEKSTSSSQNNSPQKQRSRFCSWL